MNKRSQFIYNSIKKNLKVWFKFKLVNKEHVAGNRFIDSDEMTVINTVDSVFKSYQQYGGFSHAEIKNKKVLEIGPGDSFGVALNFLFAGAEKVVCFDKFYARRDQSLLKQVYKTMLAKQTTYEFDELFDENLIPKASQLDYYFGKGIEKIKFNKKSKLAADTFDIIVSNQVIQEIYNPFPALKKMVKLLKKGGKMVHYIDFEPYNYFRYHLENEYAYLTFPEYLYKWMVNKRGMGNRKRITEYVHFLSKIKDIRFHFLVDSCFLDKQVLKDAVVYPHFSEELKQVYLNLVNSQRKNFIKKYQQLPIEDFMVGNAYLIIEKIN